MAGTPESTRAALTAALDGWKGGQNHQEMAGRSPPLYLLDDDLNSGAKLLDYLIEGDAQPAGIGYSYVVTLTLQNKEGTKAPAKKKVAYTAVTEPQQTVAREDGQP